MRGVTDRQLEVLGFIIDQTISNGYAPTIREIGNGVCISSLRGVTTHLDALLRKGLIEMPVGRARTIRLSSTGMSAVEDARGCKREKVTGGLVRASKTDRNERTSDGSVCEEGLVDTHQRVAKMDALRQASLDACDELGRVIFDLRIKGLNVLASGSEKADAYRRAEECRATRNRLLLAVNEVVSGRQ